MNGALVSRRFESLAIFVGDMQTGWKMNCGSQSPNAPDRFLDHLFRHVDSSPSQIELVAFGNQSEDRHDASSKCGRDQIGRRKRFASAAIVERRVGAQFNLARAVRCLAVQTTFVHDIDFNSHLCSFAKLSFGELSLAEFRSGTIDPDRAPF